jgi:murein DD-endopeptidase MepM/ murein hydrolase activator NlpD
LILKPLLPQPKTILIVCDRGNNENNKDFDREEISLISSPYRADRGNGKKHSGVDFAVPEGTVVRATKSGVVKRSGWQDDDDHGKGYGFRVQILNKDGTYSDYGHLFEDFIVYKDDIIEAGQEIGYSGNTGSSRGAHLHYTERNSDYSVKEPDNESIEYLLDDFARQRFDGD